MSRIERAYGQLTHGSRSEEDSAKTSIDELRRLTGLPEIAVRGGLELLVHDRALDLWQPNGDDADPERVPSDMLLDVFVAFDPFTAASDLD